MLKIGAGSSFWAFEYLNTEISASTPQITLEVSGAFGPGNH